MADDYFQDMPMLDMNTVMEKIRLSFEDKDPVLLDLMADANVSLTLRMMMSHCACLCVVVYI
jgi:hypothetical protein